MNRTLCRQTAFFVAAVLLVACLAPVAGAQLVDNPLRSYADVAEVAGPAVVNIAAARIVENMANHPFMNDPVFRRFAEALEELFDLPCELRPPGPLADGFVLEPVAIHLDAGVQADRKLVALMALVEAYALP